MNLVQKKNKSVIKAYLCFLFLNLHYLYLGKYKTQLGYILLPILGLIIGSVGNHSLGGFMLLAFILWALFDLFTLWYRVNKINDKIELYNTQVELNKIELYNGKNDDGIEFL
jgi:hypothetical protein